MNFISTRDTGKPGSFTDAIFHGLAPDGGLYQFQEIPELSSFFASLSSSISFNELSTELTTRLLEPEINRSMAEDIIDGAFSFSPVLKQIDETVFMLELFHGPSYAFKDFGAMFLGSAMDRLLDGQNRRAIILTATSGDTGSAVAQAFYNKESIDVVILYPSNRVSLLQEKQLTTLGGNIIALEIDGSFDDCQRMTKAAFTNPSLRNLPLSSANSINLGRLIPQSFYYIWAWTQMRDKGDFAFVVPSGNFGNITAGLYAQSWGLPVKHFIAATNANDVIPSYLQTGNYLPRPSIPTLSNAMDVGDPSNYERLDFLYHSDVDVFRDHVEAWAVDDKTTKNIMNRVYKEHRYLCCPHTAVGYRAAELYSEKHPGIDTVILSTAHPGKFVQVVKDAVGEEPQLPEALSSLACKEKNSIVMGNKDEDLERFLLEKYSSGHFG